MHACACVFHTWWKCHDCIGIGNMQSGESEDILEYRICICLELMWIIRSLKCYKICIIHAIHSLINHKTCRYFTYLFEFQKIFVYSNTFLKVYIWYKHSGGMGGGRSGGPDPPGKFKLINSHSKISKNLGGTPFQTHSSLQPLLEKFSGSVHEAKKGLPIYR